MTRFAIDIDDTLFPFGTEVREAFFEMAIECDDPKYLRGAYSGFNEWRELSDVLDREVALDAIHWVHDRQREQVPFKNAVRVVTRIADTYDIKYVTSRRAVYLESTTEWLEDCGFPQGEVICSEHDKTEHLWDCQYLVDDRPATILNFIHNFTWKLSHGSTNQKHQRVAFGLWQPYNRNLTDHDGVYLAPTWRGLEYYLERKGVLDGRSISTVI